MCAGKSCVDVLIYIYDARKAKGKDECYTAIVNAITAGVTGILGMASPVIKICKYNHLVSEQVKAATDWYIWRDGGILM